MARRILLDTYSTLALFACKFTRSLLCSLASVDALPVCALKVLVKESGREPGGGFNGGPDGVPDPEPGGEVDKKSESPGFRIIM